MPYWRMQRLGHGRPKRGKHLSKIIELGKREGSPTRLGGQFLEKGASGGEGSIFGGGKVSPPDTNSVL